MTEGKTLEGMKTQESIGPQEHLKQWCLEATDPRLEQSPEVEPTAVVDGKRAWVPEKECG
jgi:hypothetical protein